MVEAASNSAKDGIDKLVPMMNSLQNVFSMLSN
jgi:hypothetical protein